MIVGIISWLIFSMLIGIIGSNRKIGFAGAFFLSLLLSPLIGLIFTLVSKSLSDEKYEKELLEVQRKQKEAIENLSQKNASSVSSELARTAELFEKGIINESEFEKIKTKLIEELESQEQNEQNEDQQAEVLKLYQTYQGEIYIKQNGDTFKVGDAVLNYYKRPYYNCRLKLKNGPLIVIESGKIIEIN